MLFRSKAERSKDSEPAPQVTISWGGAFKIALMNLLVFGIAFGCSLLTFDITPK